jgi:hypothetical protein
MNKREQQLYTTNASIRGQIQQLHERSDIISELLRKGKSTRDKTATLPTYHKFTTPLGYCLFGRPHPISVAHWALVGLHILEPNKKRGWSEDTVYILIFLLQLSSAQFSPWTFKTNIPMFKVYFWSHFHPRTIKLTTSILKLYILTTLRTLVPSDDHLSRITDGPRVN